MQAVILIAGKSSRLYPFSEQRHKSMLTFFGKPLLDYTIEGLKRAGVLDIVLVVDKKSQASSYFASGENFGVRISYVVRNVALGMGDALLGAKDLLQDEFIVLHGHHIDAESLVKKIVEKKQKGAQSVLLVKKRKDYWNHGVVSVESNRVVSVVEKPKQDQEKEKLCIVGVYLLSKDFVLALSKTPMEHYQFETSLSHFVEANAVSYVIITEDTVSLKYPWDIFELKDYLFRTIKKREGKNVLVSKSAELIGDVWTGDNVIIREGARVKGPCYLGDNVVVGTNAILRNGVVIERDCVVGAQMEIKNSVLMSDTTTHSGFIGDSVIGEHCKIAAQCTTANVRLDRQNVKVLVKGESVDTKRRSLGVIMGSNVKVGINCSIMPGVVIGNDVIVGPSTTVRSNVQSGVTYYTKFQEIIEEKHV